MEQQMNGVLDNETDGINFVEVDPTGRYGRYNEILGKGASKMVYKGFDEYEGIEVAWNQVKLYDFLQRPEDLERLYCEIHLLKTLNHNNIMKFYTSWVDTTNRNVNFVTEMFTSGTLRQYRLRHKRVNIRAVKHWCRQILKGLLYLHSRDPPVIHRDLKCDNIFINGNHGEVKIGDLGLAAILRKSHAARCVGTPEFMAPEVYAEEYNELVDIYSFGMCILEMVTFDYPYSECTHPAQIYKKVVSGKKPDALYKVKDPEVRQFVEKCLASVSSRLSAKELLEDPFLHIDRNEFDFRPLDYYQSYDDVHLLPRQPLLKNHLSESNLINGCSSYLGYDSREYPEYHSVEFKPDEIHLFANQEEDEHLASIDISINGRRREDDGIFLRLRIGDKEGRMRNIYFHFDIENDTGLSVATEMIDELDITIHDVTKIAKMIDNEIASLVPEWKRGRDSNSTNTTYCQNCVSNGSLVGSLPSNGLSKNLQVLECSQQGCASIHGRFEEITYLVEGSERCVTEGAPPASSQSDGIHYTDIWAQHDGPELSLEFSKDYQTGDKNDYSYDLEETDKRTLNVRDSISVDDDYENEIRKELRWLKAKYQIQLRDHRNNQIRKEAAKSDKVFPASCDSFSSGKDLTSYYDDEKSCGYEKDRKLIYESCCSKEMATAKSFYKGALLPSSLHRATSLPVDAVDI